MYFLLIFDLNLSKILLAIECFADFYYEIILKLIN